MINGRKLSCLLLPLLVGCQSNNFSDGMALSANHSSGINSSDHNSSGHEGVQSFNVSKVAEPLSLQLDISEANTKRLNLVATLTNISNQDLVLSVPEHLNPLTVLVWSADGYNLTHRISRRLESEHRQLHDITIAAGDSWVINASVDLTKYKDAIRPSGQTFVSAQYDSFNWHGNDKLPSLVYSNKIFLTPNR